MSSSQEGPNPLRPYYVPPSVTVSPEVRRPGVAVSNGSKSASATSNSLGSSARNILSDIDYTDYLSDTGPSSTEVIKRLIEHALWKYTSLLLAQPFDVAKTVLQVHVSSTGQKSASRGGVAPENARRRQSGFSQDSYEVC